MDTGDLFLVDVFLQDEEKDRKCYIIIDFSIVAPAAESYREEASMTPLYTAKLKERKNQQVSMPVSIRSKATRIFKLFVIESRGISARQHYHPTNGAEQITYANVLK